MANVPIKSVCYHGAKTLYGQQVCVGLGISHTETSAIWTNPYY